MSDKIKKVKTTSFQDTETGEILQEKTSASIIGIDREPKHIKLYMQDISAIYDVPSSLMKTMYVLLDKALTSDNMLALLPSARKKVAKILGISERTLQNRLRILVVNEFLFNDNTKYNNEYFINSKIFGKGEWSKIKKSRSQIKTKIYYKNGKRTVFHQFEF